MTATISASVAGSWINGAAVVTSGANHQVINPATGDVVAELALATPGDVDAAVAVGPQGTAGLGGRDPGRPRDDAGQAGGADVRTRRRARRRGGQPDRQARAAGAGVRCAGQHRQHRLLRRRRAPSRGQGHRGVLRRPHLEHPARGRRRRRDHHAVELPAADGGVEGAARVGRRLRASSSSPPS